MENLKGKSFLKLLDLTPAQIEGLLALAADFKAKKKAGISLMAVIHPVMSSFNLNVAGRPFCVWSKTLPLISLPV